jgi:hypothetical protein
VAGPVRPSNQEPSRRGFPLKPLKAIALLILLLPAVSSVQGKTKKPDVLPAVLNQARYVYVQAVDGDEFDPRLAPEDRQAIANVRDALHKWSRYTLVIRREDADLIFVVRKGRLVEAKAGVQASTGPQGVPGRQSPTQPSSPAGRGVGVGVGGEVGPPDDLFEVFEPNSGGVAGSPLYMRTLADGLSGSKPILFEQFKDAVEHDYPSQTASQPHKP